MAQPHGKAHPGAVENGTGPSGSTLGGEETYVRYKKLKDFTGRRAFLGCRPRETASVNLLRDKSFKGHDKRDWVD